MSRTACTESQCLYNGALYLTLSRHKYMSACQTSDFTRSLFGLGNFKCSDVKLCDNLFSDAALSPAHRPTNWRSLFSERRTGAANRPRIISLRSDIDVTTETVPLDEPAESTGRHDTICYACRSLYVWLSRFFHWPVDIFTNYMEHSPSYEANSTSAKKFHDFHGTRRFITAFTNSRHLSVSWA